MATRLFLTSPGVATENTVEGVGAAIQSSFIVALTVDLNTAGLDAGARQVNKAEVKVAIDNLWAYIEKINWPPA